MPDNERMNEQTKNVMYHTLSNLYANQNIKALKCMIFKNKMRYKKNFILKTKRTID